MDKERLYTIKFQEMTEAFNEFANKVTEVGFDMECPLFQSYVFLIGSNVLLARSRMGSETNIEDVMLMLREIYIDQVVDLVDEEIEIASMQSKLSVKH